IVSFEVGKARLSGGRRRPPAARRERRDIADAIMWRRLRSGPVIIASGAKRCLGEACFVRMVASDREPAGGVQGADGVYLARPSALRTPTSPLGWSVACLRRPQTTIDAPWVVDLSAPSARYQVTSSFS
ncbi:hypothetical protein THAOC_34235, partial [Thalassiosira oceanica]